MLKKYIFILLLAASCQKPLPTNNFIQYYQLGNSTEAITILEESCKKNNDEIYTLLNLGLIHFSLGNTETALTLFVQARRKIAASRVVFKKYCLSFANTQVEAHEEELAAIYQALCHIHLGQNNEALALLSSYQEHPLANYLLKKLSSINDTSSIVVIVHNGNAPYKTIGYADASVASSIDLENFLDFKGPTFDLKTFPAIPVPYLQQKILSNRFPVLLKLGTKEVVASPIFNILQVASQSLNKEIPYLVAKGVVEKLQKKESSINLKNWSTLPCSIDIADFNTERKKTSLYIQTNWSYYPLFIKEIPLELIDKDCCVINLFNIHPGIVSIQVPNKYKTKAINNSEILKDWRYTKEDIKEQLRQINHTFINNWLKKSNHNLLHGKPTLKLLSIKTSPENSHLIPIIEACLETVALEDGKYAIDSNSQSGISIIIPITIELDKKSEVDENFLYEHYKMDVHFHSCKHQKVKENECNVIIKKTSL